MGAKRRTSSKAALRKHPKITNGKKEPYSAPLMRGLEMKLPDDYIIRMIRQGWDVNQPGEGNLQPLHLAIQRSSLDVARALIKKGANVDARDMRGYTPLQYAVSAANTEAVRLLLQHRADATVVDESKATPLINAIRRDLRQEHRGSVDSSGPEPSIEKSSQAQKIPIGAFDYDDFLHNFTHLQSASDAPSLAAVDATENGRDSSSSLSCGVKSGLEKAQQFKPATNARTFLSKYCECECDQDYLTSKQLPQKSIVCHNFIAIGRARYYQDCLIISNMQNILMDNSECDNKPTVSLP